MDLIECGMMVLNSNFKKNGISGKLLLLLKDVLRSAKQRVVLNGQHSSWRDVNTGIPHGSILGPLLFLVYITCPMALSLIQSFLLMILLCFP